MDVYPGLIVKATAGRDKDKFFVVVGIVDDLFCLIADGKTRKVDMPKKKKLKHLLSAEVCLEGIKEKLDAGQAVTNSMIRKEIAALNLALSKEG